MKFTILFAALASCVVAVPAFAGPETAPFTGPKIGVDLGYDFNNAGAILPGDKSQTREAAGGPSIRGFAGYDLALDPAIIVGLEAGIGTGGHESTLPFAGGSTSISPGLTYDLTGRVGFVATPKLLLYGRGGVRWLRTTNETVSTTPNQVVAENKSTESGLTYGAGAEYALTSKVSMRAEFNRTRFDRDLSQNKISVGAAFHF